MRSRLAASLVVVAAGCTAASGVGGLRPASSCSVPEGDDRVWSPKTLAEIRRPGLSVRLRAFRQGCVLDGTRYELSDGGLVVGEHVVHGEFSCDEAAVVSGEQIRCRCMDASPEDEELSGPLILPMCRKHGPCCLGDSWETDGGNFQIAPDGGVARCLTKEELIRKIEESTQR